MLEPSFFAPTDNKGGHGPKLLSLRLPGETTCPLLRFTAEAPAAAMAMKLGAPRKHVLRRALPWSVGIEKLRDNSDAHLQQLCTLAATRSSSTSVHQICYCPKLPRKLRMLLMTLFFSRAMRLSHAVSNKKCRKCCCPSSAAQTLLFGSVLPFQHIGLSASYTTLCTWAQSCSYSSHPLI